MKYLNDIVPPEMPTKSPGYTQKSASSLCSKYPAEEIGIVVVSTEENSSKLSMKDESTYYSPTDYLIIMCRVR